MVDKQYNFQEFTKKGRPAVPRAMVSMQKRGTFTLNSAARALLGDLDAALHVVLGYDLEHRAISMRVVDADDPNCYPVRHQFGDKTWAVAGQAFCTYHDIPIGQVKRYKAHLLEPGVLVFELEQG